MRFAFSNWIYPLEKITVCGYLRTNKHTATPAEIYRYFLKYTYAFLPLQVNGKSYNQARLQLGKMGSLHPANRLAAYVTGRLNASVDVPQKNSQKSDSTHKTSTPKTGTVKVASSLVSPSIAARKTTDLKTLTPSPGKVVSLLLDHSRGTLFYIPDLLYSKLPPPKCAACSSLSLAF